MICLRCLVAVVMVLAGLDCLMFTGAWLTMTCWKHIGAEAWQLPAVACGGKPSSPALMVKLQQVKKQLMVGANNLVCKEKWCESVWYGLSSDMDFGAFLSFSRTSCLYERHRLEAGKELNHQQKEEKSLQMAPAVVSQF